MTRKKIEYGDDGNYLFGGHDVDSAAKERYAKLYKSFRNGYVDAAIARGIPRMRVGGH